MIALLFLATLPASITDIEQMALLQTPRRVVRQASVQKLLKLSATQREDLLQVLSTKPTDEAVLKLLNQSQQRTLRQASLRTQVNLIYHDELLPKCLAGFNLDANAEEVVSAVRTARNKTVIQLNRKKLEKLAEVLAEAGFVTKSKAVKMIGEPFPFRKHKPGNYWTNSDMEASHIPRIRLSND